MNQSQIPTLDPAPVRAQPTRLRVLESPRPHVVGAVDHLVALIESTDGGPVERSLLDLASAVSCDVETARRAVASLDPVDHAVSVDIGQVPAEERWILAWAPVTGIVDLMLDWDLLTLEISVAELAEWLGASVLLTEPRCRLAGADTGRQRHPQWPRPRDVGAHHHRARPLPPDRRGAVRRRVTGRATPKSRDVAGRTGGGNCGIFDDVHVDHGGLTCGNVAAAPCRRSWS